jgi:hypothetical protein
MQHAIEANRLTTGEAATPISVRCLPSVDLTGSSRVTCIANIHDKDVRREVFVDPVRGIDTRAIDALIDLRLAGLAIGDNLSQRPNSDGKTRAVLHCGTGFLVVAASGTFDCEGTAAGKPLRIEVTVTDTTGAFDYKVVDQK